MTSYKYDKPVTNYVWTRVMACLVNTFKFLSRHYHLGSVHLFANNCQMQMLLNIGSSLFLLI